MRISVIITAYNNENTIEECLESFINQSLDDKLYEIVVVNDGSTDETAAKSSSLKSQISNLRNIEQENQGVAAARNRGAQEASGDVILFTQADIIAASDELIEKHLNFHRNHPKTNFALVGHTTWHPDLEITPLMEWLETGGPQFKFQQPGQVNFFNFYTTNVSLKKESFDQVSGFDEDFKLQAGMTAYEDTELGFRLQKAGLRLYYDPTALVYHHHRKTLDNVLRRRYFEGVMSHKLIEKHPDFKWDRATSDRQVFLLSGWLLNPLVMYPFKLLADHLQNKTAAPWLYKAVTRAWYNWGYLRGYLS